MTDVKEQPLDGPKKDVVDLWFCRKAGDVSGFVDAVAGHTWMMLIRKGDEVLTCCVVAA